MTSSRVRPADPLDTRTLSTTTTIENSTSQETWRREARRKAESQIDVNRRAVFVTISGDKTHHGSYGTLFLVIDQSVVALRRSPIASRSEYSPNFLS